MIFCVPTPLAIPAQRWSTSRIMLHRSAALWNFRTQSFTNAANPLLFEQNPDPDSNSAAQKVLISPTIFASFIIYPIKYFILFKKLLNVYIELCPKIYMVPYPMQFKHLQPATKKCRSLDTEQDPQPCRWVPVNITCNLKVLSPVITLLQS